MLPAPARVLVVLFRVGAATAGVMTGNRPAAFPAAMTVVMMRFTSAAGIAAAGGTAGNRPAALSALMIIPVVLVMAGISPGGSAELGRDVPAAPAEPAGEAAADGGRDADRAGLALDEGDRVGLALRVGDGDAERAGVALAVGDGDAERAGVALAVGDGDAERAGVALAVGDGDAERAGVALAVGDGDAERAGVALADGDGDAERAGVALAVGDGVADADVDGGVDGDADVVEGDGEADVAGDDEPVADGCGKLEAGETGLASAAPWTPTDSPKTSRPPVTRPAATTRTCAEDVLVVLPAPPARLARRGRPVRG